MKKCPYCAESIQDEAKKCKHCGEWLPEFNVRESAVPSESTRPPTEISEASSASVAPTRQSESHSDPSNSAAESFPIFELSPKILLAWAVATLWLLALGYRELLNPDVPVTVKWLAVGVNILNVGFTLQLIRRVRGPDAGRQVVPTEPSVDRIDRQLVEEFRSGNRNPQTAPSNGSAPSAPLSAWGYIWRSMVASMAARATVLLAENVFSVDRTRVDLNPLNMIVWEVVSLSSIAFVCWLLFSRDRRGQLKFLVSTMRGY